MNYIPVDKKTKINPNFITHIMHEQCPWDRDVEKWFIQVHVTWRARPFVFEYDSEEKYENNLIRLTSIVSKSETRYV